ncbi:La-related protein like [Melia azedarach]|uniref:La-related protein like n=1 Tax=Melia azedarach TaxID=155640 RepID=A0ACC1YJP1_MELAZ|nr:La-related protein like [Melia azedarach]
MRWICSKGRGLSPGIMVEYYFSDLNLATTDHLMRFIFKDPEGYVPISVVASFKKIKALTSSNSQLASVLQKSSKLVVSEDGKKVKRQNPLNEADLEELQSRIVVAENLPEDHCHQNLMKIFSAVGSVKNIRTCLPQTSGGGAASASRSAKADGMLYSNKLHAFVEYESVELAEKAIAELNNEGNWRSGLRVRLMLRRGSKTAQARGKKGHEGEWQYEEEDASTSEQHSNEKQSEDPSQHDDVHSHEHAGEENYNEKEGGQRKGRNKGRGKGRGRGDRGQYHHNNQGDRGQYHHHNHGNRGHHVGTPPSNNMVNNDQPTIGKQPPGPRMPDGTRGFAMGRGKPVAVNTA